MLPSKKYFVQMTAIKKTRDWIVKHPTVAFFLLTGKVYELIKGLFESPSMDNVIHFLKHFDWVEVVILLIAVLLLVGQLSHRKKEYADLDARVHAMEEFVRLKDEKEIEDEMLLSVCFWINAFNRTESERDEYVKYKFPKNEKKIQEYFKAHYQGVGVGIREFHKSISVQIRSTEG